MPLSNGLRSRRGSSGKNGGSRRISAQRIGLSGLAQLLPKAVIVPIILFAGITATFAAFWTYDIHIEQAQGDVDDQEMIGTVDSAN